VILVAHDGGHVAVTQAAHAAMCVELGRAWGNARFGAVEPADEVLLAAEEHELGWREWDRAPELDPATGLPFSVRDLDLDVHLPMQVDGPRELADRSPYAALLASLKHASMYSRPSPLGLVRADGRRVRDFLDRSRALQTELRARLDLGDDEVERNWRLVRAWDALSHDLLFDRAPCTRPAVPAAGGDAVDLRLERRGGAHVLNPWPFAADRVEVHAAGRLLEAPFDDQERMRGALAAAPEVTLTYELVRP
jgi:Protein of unknown function (DUF3891)